jgi:hypothetical protein
MGREIVSARRGAVDHQLPAEVDRLRQNRASRRLGSQLKRVDDTLVVGLESPNQPHVAGYGDLKDVRSITVHVFAALKLVGLAVVSVMAIAAEFDQCWVVT